MKREYWLVCAFVRPMHCAKVHATIALSEPLENFIARNVRYHRKYNEFTITSLIQIDGRKYKALKSFNPTNESYFRLVNKDCSQIVSDEEEAQDREEEDE